MTGGTAQRGRPRGTGATDRSWLDTESPAIRPGVEITEGINRELVAFDAETGHYTRLSRSGAAILRALDGSMTGREFTVRALRESRRDSLRDPASERILTNFLDELRAAGLLTVPPAPGRRSAAARFARRSHMPRKALITGRVSVLLDPVAGLLRRAPAVFAALWGAAALLALVAAWSVVSAPHAAEHLAPTGLTWGWALVAGILLVQTVVHELCHAVVCRYHGIRVREIGVGLLFYVVPAAYVDRTDAYRLPGRGSRVAIALAGVASDVLWLGGCAFLAREAGGEAGRALGVLVLLQIAFLLANLNPLLPTDGYQALEAGLGAINLRARSFTVLRCLVLRQPAPSWLATRGRVARLRYVVFGLVCLVYAALIAALMLRAVVTTVAG
ncbi:PqqD family peptide modification chaperone [Streptomyces sp. NPDC048639]|uniref:PqqD family peptide modification chaperone n=1 Tax=Streptomyces sp. NPDC048639 TaxID=3365581 RepID=UPI00371994B3